MTATADVRASAPTLFSRVIAGADGSEAGWEAVRQAARLVTPDGWLETFTAVHLTDANLAGWSAPRIRAELDREAAETARKAAEIAGPRTESRLVNGRPYNSLMRELIDREATLAVVGTHGHSRLSEIVIGGVAGELLHNAPCSICIARPAAVEALFPLVIVVGVDGSPESEQAVRVAAYLSGRFRVPLSLVAALGGKDVDREKAAAFGAVEVEGHPVDALVEASSNADILVVGSRGLHGWKALGSVSERVAHKANCSVLVVRGSD